jgi:hypothetical protein
MSNVRAFSQSASSARKEQYLLVGAVLGDEALDVVAAAPAARLARYLERRLADVGQGEGVAHVSHPSSALGRLSRPDRSP